MTGRSRQIVEGPQGGHLSRHKEWLLGPDNLQNRKVEQCTKERPRLGLTMPKRHQADLRAYSFAARLPKPSGAPN